MKEFKCRKSFRMLDIRETVEILEERKIGTPCLVIDPYQIEMNYNLIKELLGLDQVFYSIKANPDRRILELLYEIGSGFEACSENELRYLFNLGFGKEKILFSPVALSGDVELLHLVDNMVINNRGIVCYVNQHRGGFKNLYFRVRFKENGNGIVLHQNTVGLFPNELGEVVDTFKQENLGLAMHVGSFCKSLDLYFIYLSYLKELSSKYGGVFSRINLGGGFVNGINDKASTTKKKYQNIKEDIRINFPRYHVSAEPGRFLISNAGHIITKIIDKFLYNGREVIRIDCGIYNGLLDVALLDLSLRLLSLKKGEKRTYKIIGPTNDSKDVIAEDVSLPTQSVGDLLVFPNCGAYSTVLATSFCGLDMPKILFKVDRELS